MFDRLAWVAIGGGCIVRIGWGLLVHPPLDYVYSDMGGYVGRAQRLASGASAVRLDAFFPSGTHVLLAGPMFVFGVGRLGLWADAVLWCALSCAVPWLAWRWTRRLVGVAAASATAVMVALWPLLFTQPTFFMSEVPAEAFLLGALLLGTRLVQAECIAPAELAAFGAVAGFGFTVRPQLALNFAIAAFPVLWRLRRVVVFLGLAAAAAVIPVAVVAAVNFRATHAVTIGSENGGVNFFLAQCDGGSISTAAVDATYVISSPVFVQKQRGRAYHFEGRHIWDQAFFFHEGVRCIRLDGIGHLRLLGRHLQDLTVTSDPWPQADDPAMRRLVHPVNVVYSLVLPGVVVLAISRMARSRDDARGEGLLLAHLACVLPTVVVFVSEPRYRIPYDVFGLALIASLLARSRSRSTAPDMVSGGTNAT